MDERQHEQYAMSDAANTIVSNVLVAALNSQHWEVVSLARYRDGAEYKVTLRHTGYDANIPIEVSVIIDALPVAE